MKAHPVNWLIAMFNRYLRLRNSTVVPVFCFTLLTPRYKRLYLLKFIGIYLLSAAVTCLFNRITKNIYIERLKRNYAAYISIDSCKINYFLI